MLEPIWIKQQVPSKFWKNLANRRQYMEWLAETLGFRTPDDWYKITQQDFRRNKGRGCLNYYQDSHFNAVKEYLPDYNWKEWLFTNVPLNFWRNLDNRRRYMRWLGERLGYKNPEDWYRVKRKTFLSNNGGSLLTDYYHNSPLIALKEFFPDYNWKEWLFENVPLHFWQDPNNRRRYMEWLGETLGYKRAEDWYKITQKDFYANRGRGLLSGYYYNSPSAAVIEYFPNDTWNEWLFGVTANGFWSKQINRFRYMGWLGKTLGIQKPEDWYGITQNDFYKNKGHGCLKYYRCSPSNAVKEYLPDYDWKEWLFTVSPQNFWQISENRHRYMEWLGEILNFRKPEDWYRLTQKDFRRNNGRGCLNYYQDSHSNAVKEYLPEYEWKEWLFGVCPQKFWQIPENRHRYMRWFGKKLGYQKIEDWYRVTARDFSTHKGGGLLTTYYQASPALAVKEFLPNHEWKEWLFDNTPQNFWNEFENRHRYMNWLRVELGVQTYEDRYKVTTKDFYKHNGGGCLEYYGGSPSTSIMKHFPGYEWKEWLFVMSPLKFWKESSNRHRYMQWLGKILEFQSNDDWYRVTYDDLKRNKGSGVLKYCQNSPSIAVMDYLPEHDWQPEKFSFRKKRQKQLYRIVKRIFSEHEVKWDFKHSQMKFEISGRPMELDIFIASLNIAFEYQGEQHVLPIEAWGGIPALKERQKRDEEKREACRINGIILIEVPHSWDGREETVIEILSYQLNRKMNAEIEKMEQIHIAVKTIDNYCSKKQTNLHGTA